MKASAENIWRVPAYLPYLQPNLTPDIVSRAESELGAKLPSSYISILSRQNGGYVRYTLPESCHSEIWGIGPRYPSITGDHYWRNGGAEDGDAWLPTDPQKLIPFDGDGHWHLCFDYRESGPSGEPCVTHIDLECGREEPIAPNFGSFLGLLKLEIGNAFGILGNYSLDAIAALLEEALGKPFKDMGSSGHGYPVFRFDLASAGNPQWVWVSPNVVPRGFVRPSDRLYAEVAGALPGNALRFPESPDVSVIIGTTPAIADAIRAACIQASLKLAPLEVD